MYILECFIHDTPITNGVDGWNIILGGHLVQAKEGKQKKTNGTMNRIHREASP